MTSFKVKAHHQNFALIYAALSSASTVIEPACSSNEKTQAVRGGVITTTLRIELNACIRRTIHLSAGCTNRTERNPACCKRSIRLFQLTTLQLFTALRKFPGRIDYNWEALVQPIRHLNQVHVPLSQHYWYHFVQEIK
jgi:hypothetical protein